MAKAMVTLTWCDRCLTDNDTETPARPMPEVQGMNLDLCDGCAAPLLEALAMYERYGARGKRTPTLAAVTKRKAAAKPGKDATVVPANAVETFICPDAGCGAVLGSRQSLGAHARQIHHVTLGELEGKPIIETCAECGAGFTTHQGITLHQRKHARSA